MDLNDPYFRVQAARRALRAAAHKYARVKNTPLNRPQYEKAVEALEKAALVFALSAAEHGTRSEIARPAFSALSVEQRREYEDAVDPEPQEP